MDSPLDSKEIKPINPKGNQSWIFIGRTNAEAEAPILWPPDVKNWLIGKDPDAGKHPDAGKDWEEGGDRRGDGWIVSLTQRTLSLSKLWEIVKEGKLTCCSSWDWRVGHNLVTEQLQLPASTDNLIGI